MTTHRRDGERGTVLILALGLVAIAAAGLAVAVDVAVLHLRHREGQLTADAAARSGAQQLDLASYYRSRLPGDALPLDPGAARRRVIAHLRGADDRSWQLTGFTIDRDSITVSVEQEVPLPVTAPGAPASVTVTGTATAQLRRQEPA